MTRAPLNLARAGRTFSNAFRSEGASLFGWPFIRDYLTLVWQSSRNWGATDPGTLEFVGSRIAYFNRSDAVFLLHEIFVNAVYFFPASTPAPRIIDCGANIGMATLFFKALYPAASVIAVEPAPQTFERLQQNVSGNHLRDVTLVNAAIAEQAGSIAMHRQHAGPGSMVATTVGPPGEATERVPAITLSSLLDQPADFVKLDVEGAEYGAIRELVASGRGRQFAQMVMEYHEADTRSAELAAMIGSLRALGMKVDQREDPGGKTGTLRVSARGSVETGRDSAGRRGRV